MKTFLLLAAALVTASGTAFAQDLTGDWQGTLTAPNGQMLRTVIRIAKSGTGMQGTLHSIDQGGVIPVNPITLQGTAVKMTIPGIGGSYEGRLEADGNSITGNVSQGPNLLPLNLKRATPETAWAIPAPPPPLAPMPETANPSFEVATIKPSDPNRPGRLFTVKGRQFITINTNLADLINFAYGVHARQVINGPSWMDADKFDITAQPDGPGQPNDRQWKMMVQKLLTDRFGLKFHRDKRELSVYAITVGRNGHKLTQSAGDPNGLPSLFFRGLGNLPAANATITDFAGVLQSAVLDRPVVDQTGLKGRWDFQLQWTPDEFQFGGLGVRPPAPTGDAAAPPDIYTAFQEQLGLKLEGTRAQAEVLVVDAVSKPSEN
jgi:uncharacterized protein (TIGR03435 family)